MRLASTTAWTLAALLALAGCGGPDRAAGPAGVSSDWTSCVEAVPDLADRAAGLVPGGNDALNLPRLGDDFDPVSVTVCAVQPERRPDGGQELVLAESRATELGALLTALRLPDQPRTGGACADVLRIVPWLALHDAQGRWMRPGVPVDACGQPRGEVLAAVDALALTRVATTVVREIESAGAVAAGCSQAWADMVWVETSTGRTGGPRPTGPLFGGSPQVRLCVYEVPDSEKRSGKPAGTFVRGGVLPPDVWAALVPAVVAGGAAVPCTTPAGRFAVLRAEGAAGTVYVELDGCQRVMYDPGSGPPALWQAAPELAGRLAR